TRSLRPTCAGQSLRSARPLRPGRTRQSGRPLRPSRTGQSCWPLRPGLAGQSGSTRRSGRPSRTTRRHLFPILGRAGGRVVVNRAPTVGRTYVAVAVLVGRVTANAV